MPTEAQIAFVQDKLAQNKAFFQLQSSRSKRRWVIIRTMAIMISGVVTIILGLKATPGMAISSDLTANVALVLSACATFLAAVEATFDYRWTWINYSLTLTRIYGIEDDLEYKRMAGELSQDDLDDAFTALSETLQSVNYSWKERRLRDAGNKQGNPS